jgi:predicted ferric reductase
MTKLNFPYGWLLIVLLSLLPLIPLLINSPSLSNYENFTHVIGQITGLIGMNFFALTFILSSRFKFLENIFGGLDKVYKVHSVIGALALVCILFHPLFLVLKYLPGNFELAAKYMLPGGHWAVDFGIIALLGLILLLVLTLYMKMKYNRWKLTHEFLGICFMFAVLHIFLVRGTVSRDDIFPYYYVYVAIVALIGLTGFFYSLLLRRQIVSAGYRVESVKSKNNCYDITLSPIGKPKHYNAGQFMFLRFHNKKLSSEAHPFSIASKSDSEKLRFVIKALGDFTAKLSEVKVNDRVTVEGPYGRFNKKSTNDQVWIAGGIGVTPFLGMARDLNNPDFKVDLYYSVRANCEFIALDELKQAEKNNKNFRVIEWVSNDKGFLSVDEIKKQSGNLLSKEFYICGPNEMKIALRNALISAGVDKSKIYEEDFKFK